MKTLIVTTTLLLMATSAMAKTYKVAVIDSGYNGPHTHLCDTGHYDFITHTPTIGPDDWDHGTMVVKAINHYAGFFPNYCIQVYRVFGRRGDKASSANITAAITQAAANGADVINLSMDGAGYDPAEHEALRFVVRHNVSVFIAAGNKGLNLDKSCNTYPACYQVPGTTIVGAQDDYGVKHGNYGNVVEEWEAFCFESFCGTSAATAVATGKWLHDTEN